jgi:protein tyrosine phosphatase (PTP) superfamily phosphohydrolase (DUF442 family)
LAGLDSGPTREGELPSAIEAIAGVANACQVLPHLVSGGQPLAAHLEAFREAGGATVLDIRDPMEPRPIDEPTVARRIGLEYVNVPVVAGRLDDELLARVLGVLREAGDRTTLFHCASGNRCGGPLIAHLMLDHGFDEEDAVAVAMRGGLRSAEVLQWGVDYVRRHRPPGGGGSSTEG